MAEKKTRTKIIPLHDRVVIAKEEHDTQTKSGIYIPENTKEEKPESGVVIAVGPGKLLEDGTRLKMSVSAGDTVLFSKYSPEEVVVDGKNYIVVREESILGIIKQ